MPDDFQHLLDRIQKEGVDRADEKARQIIADAEARAAAIVKDAEASARQKLGKAETDAQVFDDRARKALKQAARDVILSVGGAVSATIERIVSEQTGKALTIDVLKQMLVRIAEAYSASGTAGGRVDVVFNPKDEAQVKSFFLSELRKAAEQGMQIRSDNEVIAGFRVSVVDGHVHHDFTQEAIAEALCQLLRPHLAEIVRTAVPDEK